jgi:lipopolysaccharide export system protein LptA
MAASIPDAPRVLRAGLVIVCALAGVAAHAAQRLSQAPINLEAASSDFDYRNNALLFRRVKITQGAMQVEAMEARATGLSFENAEWSLQGDVRITVPDGRLAANDAKVIFRNDVIVSALVRGSPASFEQRLKDSGQLAQGKAASIEYDVQASTVRLSGQAWLTDGQNEIHGDTLVYDIAQQRVVANPGQTDPGGVRITINPRSREATPDPPPATPP